ncbi:MAG: hypothetical protein H6732_11405 [Alphaproteobacteria bacterium]|nr:hypothetical protein [Alphaproteobacteria bacterium]
MRLILLALLGCWSSPLDPVRPPRDAATALDEAKRAPADPLLGRWRVELPGVDTTSLAAIARGEATDDEAGRAAGAWIAAHPDDPRSHRFGEAAGRLQTLEIEVGPTTWVVHDGERTWERTWNVASILSSGEQLALALELARPDGAVERVDATWQADGRVEVRRRVGTTDDAVLLRRLGDAD